ncbi:MAG TPA: aminoglycoside phosphotransferase family protein [Actinocrinis sp.]|nr:aminoglycoside phosphotransferase family protein [Actinocrinis sp.]
MPEELNLQRAGDLFAELLPARGPVDSVSRFAEGSVTGAYRVEFANPDAAPVVLKVYEADNLWCAAKEARALKFLTDQGIDISPRVLAFAKSAEALGGRPCVVSSMRPGRTLTMLDDELTRTQRFEIYRQLGEVLSRLHAIPAAGYGYVIGEIHDPVPDNSMHMARIFERELGLLRENHADPALAEKLAAHVAAHASAFAECPRPAYCHGDVHEPNLLAEVAEDGACVLTGLLDPLNLHAGDPLMDFARLDAFSMQGDPTKIAGLLRGYGVQAQDEQPGKHPGAWPAPWRPRLRLYRIALALELYNWFSSTGEVHALPGLARDLRTLMDEPRQAPHPTATEPGRDRPLPP